MQPLENCIGPTIRIGREILCLPYAGFFFETSKIKNHFYKKSKMKYPALSILRFRLGLLSDL